MMGASGLSRGATAAVLRLKRKRSKGFAPGAGRALACRAVSWRGPGVPLLEKIEGGGLGVGDEQAAFGLPPVLQPHLRIFWSARIAGDLAVKR